MHSWTRSLSKVEKINLGRYGLSPINTLRGVVDDWDFLRACIRLWDPEAHVFRFGAMMEEMCPLFEESYAIIGCDPNAPLVKHEVKIGYVRSFESLFQFSRPQAKAMIVGDQKAVLLPLIDKFSDVHSNDPNRMRLRMRALVFCLLASFLFNQDPGFGDLHFCPMVRQMEDMGCNGGIVLAETIRSLDRAALGFDDWTVSPIISRYFSSSPFPSFFPLVCSFVIEKIHYSGLVKGPPPSGCCSYISYNPSQYLERPRRNALLSALEGWVQAAAANEVGIDEEIVLAPRTGEVGESSAARDDSEDVAPRRRRDS
ncbi:hypothetical protein JCGZ_00094 [Jatropha curcas]|uniref:Aminotransferase-like plant mobile domain-containing protein n=1 Tax=Jatropha curcas TaxID=180498 RepID=A0A067L3X1_JATCU|nr:hypothetical protein JCGZ_00094 [Jatropha curcas]